MASVGAEQWSWGARTLDRLWHAALPVLALTLGSLPLLFVHALEAAANPLISLFGLSIAGLLSGSLLIEVIMSWPGLGPLLLEAIRTRDVHLVIGAVLLSCVLLVVGNLIADLMLHWLDPRVRAS